MTETDPLFVSYSCDSLFGEAEVFTLESDEEDAGADSSLRVLFVDGGFQSATYLGKRRFEPVFAYYKRLACAIDELEARRAPDPSKEHIAVLLLGSGAYSFPKYALTTYETISLDTVEIDPVVVDLARRFFFVDELEDRFAQGEEPRLRSYVDDAQAFLERAAKDVYSLVINDAFGGTEPVAALLESRHLQNAKRALKPSGIYALNAVVEDCDNQEQALGSIREALQSTFANVRHLVCTDEEYAGADNHLFFASDAPFITAALETANPVTAE